MASNDDGNEVSRDASFLMNVSLEGLFNSPTLASTPKKKGGTNASSKKTLFKKPNPPKTVKGAVIATCKICGKEYRTMRYYKQHVQGHALKDLASRAPDTADIIAMAPVVAAIVLEKMISKPSVGLYAPEFYELMSKFTSSKDSGEWKEFVVLICEPFQCGVALQTFCMPSVLITTFLKVCDNILTCLEKREVILEKLMKVAPGSNINVLNSFLCEFVFSFGDELVVQIFRQLRNASTCETVRSVQFDDDDRQIIYYIGGSIFHGFYQMSFRYPKSKKWQELKDVILSKIKEDKTFEELSEEQKLCRRWTEKKNRGGLIFVKENVQKFLLSTAALVATHEGDDGSISIDKVIEKVVAGDPKYDWDDIIGTSLHQELSFSFMLGVVKSFMNTHGKGMLKKKMNLINKNKATAALPLRHQVAPR